MGTTTKGLPYPESTDLIKDGAGAIQGLAEAVDDALGGALFRATVAAEAVATDTDDRLNLTLTAGDSDVFSNAGNLITYNGTKAVAIVSAHVRWEPKAAGSRRLNILHDDDPVVFVKDTPDGGAEQHVQTITWPVVLTPGDTLGMSVRQSSGAPLNVESAKFRCVVLGVTA